MKLIQIFVLVSCILSLTYGQKSISQKKNNVSLILNGNSIQYGMGIQFERFLDTTYQFSLCLPVFTDFETRSNPSINQFGKFNIATNPGIRFYFTKSNSLNFYLGTSIIIGYSYNEIKVPLYSNKTINFGNFALLGANITLVEKITLNIESGIGINYLRLTSLNNSGFHSISKDVLSYSILMGIGYKF